MAAEPRYIVGIQLGANEETTTGVVEAVGADSPAAVAGLRPKDRIVAVNGRAVQGDAIVDAIRGSAGRPLAFTVERSDRRIDLRPIRAEKFEPPEGILASTWEGLRFCGEVTVEIGKVIGRLLTGEGREEISSPVGIVQGSSEAIEQGADIYLRVLALISLSLALLNLLPLLPLDGGHIAFSVIEGIRGRAVAREIYERVSVVGIAIVLLLFFIGLTNDIGRLAD
jgi:regulator of sigma E protease